MGEIDAKAEQTIHFWRYDDGTFGAIAIERQQERKNAESIPGGVYSDKAHLKDFIKQCQNQCIENGSSVGKKKLNIKCGLSQLSKNDFVDKNKKRGRKGWEALTDFLNSCGTNLDAKKEVLRLFSGVLSGYCAQMIVPLVQESGSIPLQNRAPILVLNSNDKNFNVTFDFISKAMAALTVSTYSQGKLHFECPTFLPQAWEQKGLERCAFLQYRKIKKQFPAQYRDTAVLIYGRFFSANEIYRFIEKNRWAVPVLFDAPSKAYKVPPIRLKASSLVCSDFDWNVKTINYLVQRFVSWLYVLWDKKRWKKKWTKTLKKRLDRIRTCFFKYFAKKGVQRFNPTEQYFLILQMLTLELFLDSCADDKIIDNTQRKQVKFEWFDTLLPGCSQYLKADEGDEETVIQEIQSEEEHAKQIFETALGKMLAKENISHFNYVEQGGIYDEADPDNPKTLYWGYLRWYGSKKKSSEGKKIEPFRALVFKKRVLKICIRDFLPENYTIRGLISELRASAPDYLFKTQKVRFPQGENDRSENLENALIFEIEKMEFLSDEIRDILLNMIPDESGK